MIGFIICMDMILIACSVLTLLYSGRVIRRNDSFWIVLAIYALLCLLGASATRFFQRELPEAHAIIALLKFSASLPTVLFALKGYQIRPTLFGRYIVLAIVAGMIADIAININPVAGGTIFLAGHLLYVLAFLSEAKPSRRQVALWLTLSAFMIIPLSVFRARIGSLFYCINGGIYFCVLIATVVFSLSLERMVFAAAIVFALSDCLMIANKFGGGGMIMRIIALEVYYGSLLLYGAVLWKRKNRHAAPYGNME